MLFHQSSSVECNVSRPWPGEPGVVRIHYGGLIKKCYPTMQAACELDAAMVCPERCPP